MKPIKCTWLDKNYDLSLPTGKYSHCCKMPLMQIEPGYNAVTNPQTQRIKKQFATGEQPPECEWCWRDERAGVESYRQRFLKDYDWSSVRTELQFQLPSYCQGTCYYCTPALSTSIARYGTWLNPQATDIRSSEIVNTTSVISLQQQLDTLYSLPTDRPLNIGLVGGEPLLKDTVSDWMPEIISAAKSQHEQVTLTVCTNAWTRLDVLDQFYSLVDKWRVPVNINISVENTGARAEWVRGCDWQQLDRVARIHRQRCNTLTLKPTENFLCVSNLSDLIDWFAQVGFDYWDSGVVNQHILQTHSLPITYKKYIITARKRIPQFEDPRMRKHLNTMLDRILRTLGTRSQNYSAAIRAAETIDSIRNTDVHAAFPELRKHRAIPENK
jgi:hypothetical protein